MGPALTRIGFGLLAVVCLVLAGYTGIAAVGLVVTAKDRPLGLILGCSVLLLIALALLFAGVSFARRILTGEKKWSSGLSRGAAERIIAAGFVFFLLPIWAPLIDGRRLSWPPDIQEVIAGLAGGAFLVLCGRKRLATLDREEAD